MDAFIYEALPSRVIFGAGAADRVAEELDRLGARKALVLCTPGRRATAEAVGAHFRQRIVGYHDGAVTHVPIEAAEAARDEAQRLGADACIAVGGGSAIGLGKAIALVFGLPILAVPTTYAGSEMTPIWGLTEGSVKRTGRDPKVLPRSVVYDPALTLSLPARLSATSGMNAIAHCVEALYARDANPIISLMAEEGIRALGEALPSIIARPANLAARTQALYGAWLAGAALGSVGMALHHKLCHTLGGSFNLPHAETHAIVLPHAVAYNRAAAGAALARVARALDVEDAAAGLWELCRGLGAPIALKEVGLAEGDLDRAAELATRNAYWNPQPIERDGVRALLQDAYEGRCPASPLH